jgi:hypothetical protein
LNAEKTGLENPFSSILTALGGVTMSNNRLRVAAFVASVLVSAPAFAQQAGGIRGKVTVEAAGATPAGITVTAESAVMPRPRTR